MARIFVGTVDGLHGFDVSGAALPVGHLGREITALAPEGWELWAVLDGREVWHTAGIDWWFRVAALEGLVANCLADTRAGVVVGTSDAHLFRVAGEGIEQVGAFESIADRSRWYTPWGGPPDVRSISEDDEAVFVNVHVGGIARSSDAGETWEPTIDIDADVHRVVTGGGLVLAAGAQGLSVSEDRGASWTLRSTGSEDPYCRGVAVCGETVLVSASAGPRGANARVYRGSLHGDGLEPCREGLPDRFDANIDSSWLDALPDGKLAAFGTPDGRLFASEDSGGHWDEVASALPSIRCLLVLP